MLKISAKETWEAFLGDVEGDCKKKPSCTFVCCKHKQQSALFHKLKAVLLALVSDILTGLEHPSL